jgi:CubicO group peptidase (beta-lactamase class C family)
MKKMICFSGIFIAVTVLLFLAGSLAADEKTDKVDKLFAEWDTTVTPGCALAVVKDGQIIYERGYGMAKIEDGLAMTPTKIFDIGSTSKQFTAACVAMLVRDGKISLDDDVRKYIPELPRYEKTITINHLLHHTSGLRDYNALLELSGFRPESDSPTVEESLEVISRQKRLNYLPGEEYSYTNTGFFLLGQIVERVSGKSLNEFAQERIFRPLGMRHTIFQDDHTQIVKERASGYDKTDKGYKLDMSNWDETGDGNIYTSVEDLYLWDQAFYNNKLGKDLMDMLHTVGVLNNGKKLDYAFGLVVTEYKGLKVVEHGGAWAGFRAGFVRFPEQRFSVICLANLSSINPSGLCFKVADIYLADLLKAAPKADVKKAEPIKLSPQELEAKAGNYQDDKFGMWISLSVKEDKLEMDGLGKPLHFAPVSQVTFLAIDAPEEITLEFAPPAKGKPLQATARVGNDETFKLTKAAPLAPLTPAKLQEFAGLYKSEELLGSEYRLVVEKDGLFIKFRNAPKDPLVAKAPDKFNLEYFNIEFVRKGNKVTGFELSVGRAGHILFIRK